MYLMQLTDLVKAVSSMGLSQGELELVISARNVVWQHFSSDHTMSCCILSKSSHQPIPVALPADHVERNHLNKNYGFSEEYKV